MTNKPCLDEAMLRACRSRITRIRDKIRHLNEKLLDEQALYATLKKGGYLVEVQHG